MSNKSMINLIEVLNELQDKLTPLGVNNLIKDLPQIVVIGTQSAGKSSVLESFVGQDFLPRGKDIVTRRPLILQLRQNRLNSETYANFNHTNKTFYDFNEIRDEITAETDREVKKYEISSKPINLKITSSDVVDLTLVDLPGMTKVPVGNQPDNIETIIKDMIIEFIKNKNCIILAVSAANIDLANSDAITLARSVDPEGKRTIGVLTKLDLMDRGTDARDILLNKHEIKLKRGFIGVINRSQEDIDSNKDMKEALEEEKRFFSQTPAYQDIANKLGVKYLQNFLHKELSTHLCNELPILRDRFEGQVFELNERIGKIQFPVEDLDKDSLICETKSVFLKSFNEEVGCDSQDIPMDRLNGGALINLLMNRNYAEEIDSIFYDRNRMRQEIAKGIQNIIGTRLEVFVPNKAVTAAIRSQIKLFLEPSLKCVDTVTDEIENIVRKSAQKIKRFPKLIELFTNITLNFVRECKKECKSRVEQRVETERAYINTIHEDFRRVIEEQDIRSSHEVPISQFIIYPNKKPMISKAGWINYDKIDYWFEMKDSIFTWFTDESKSDIKGSIHMKDAVITIKGSSKLSLKTDQSVNKSPNDMTLIFNSTKITNEWKDCLELSAKDFTNNDITDSTQLGIPPHIRPQVEQVMKLVLAYVVIIKKTFKDSLPKLCQKELIDSIEDFINNKLYLKVQKSVSDIQDIVGGDPMEEERMELMSRHKDYKEALDIINKFLKPGLKNRFNETDCNNN